MAYPFPSHSAHSSYSPSPHSQYLVPTQRPRSTSRHSHHRSHDYTVYPANTGYAHSESGHYNHPDHHGRSHSSHRHPSHSAHQLPHYPHQSHSHSSHHYSHQHQHQHQQPQSHSYAHGQSYHALRERTPSMSDRIRHFFGVDHSDHHSHQPHQPHHYPHKDEHRRRHNSFNSYSGFRDDSGLHRNNSSRTGPWFFGAVDNRFRLDEHGREIDQRGRVIHRM
ncbi:hypothetical protein J3R82DRAFT_4391 [Butyriboletus roseoflavus]|nr:hypothetical protein J3R82DRAFT_4391 [Butyriboletus roseoflavus]